MEFPRQIAGIVLAGGRSTRMNGHDKALLKLGGVTLLDRAIRKLLPQVSRVAINSNSDVLSSHGFPILPDSFSGFPGPLAGILAGMDWAAEHGADYIATVACDTPFFPSALVGDLRGALTPNAIALASSGGRVHPVFGLWPVQLADDLRTHLSIDKRRSVLAYAQSHSFTQVIFAVTECDGDTLDTFCNVNTLEDLAEAERLAQKFQA